MIASTRNEYEVAGDLQTGDTEARHYVGPGSLVVSVSRPCQIIVSHGREPRLGVLLPPFEAHTIRLEGAKSWDVVITNIGQPGADVYTTFVTDHR